MVVISILRILSKYQYNTNTQNKGEQQEVNYAQTDHSNIILIILASILGGSVLIYTVSVIIRQCCRRKLLFAQEQRLFSSNLEKPNHPQIELINQGCSYAQQQIWQMNFTLLNVTYVVENLQTLFSISTSNNHYISLILTGTDFFGTWKVKGHINYTKDSLWKIFMIKRYKKQIKINQTLKKNLIIYEGETEKLENGFQGNWYIHSFQEDPNCNGIWSLWISQFSNIVLQFQLFANNYTVIQITVKVFSHKLKLFLLQLANK